MKTKEPYLDRETVIINGTSKVIPTIVTFKDFAALATLKGYTPESLAELFKGTIEGPLALFRRLMAGKPNWDIVIPYKDVLVLYHRELQQFVKDGKVRLCICGCGRRVYDRKDYASAACGKKVSDLGGKAQIAPRVGQIQNKRQ